MSDTSWTPQIFAALAGLGGVVVGSLISWGVQTKLLGRRILADEVLFQRKFDFDKEIAERKFKYDRELHDHKRKTELAEQGLTAFYECQQRLQFSSEQGHLRTRGQFARGRGRRDRDAARQAQHIFIPVERLTREKALFARLHSLRHAFAAHFGVAATEPFSAINDVQNEIISSAGVLIKITLDTLGWGMGQRPDDIDRKIEKAVQDIERLCRPVLAGTLTK